MALMEDLSTLCTEARFKRMSLTKCMKPDRGRVGLNAFFFFFFLLPPACWCSGGEEDRKSAECCDDGDDDDDDDDDDDNDDEEAAGCDPKVTWLSALFFFFRCHVFSPG